MTDFVGDMSDVVAPRTGADLRAARERLGYGLEDMAAYLRVRPHYLEALENGRLGDLPGIAYASAYLRAYAVALGLDPEEVYRKFKSEAEEVRVPTALAFPTPAPSRAIPGGAMALLGLVLAVGTYAGWYQLSGHGRLPAETVAAVPARLAPLAQQAVPAAQPTPRPAPVAPPAVVTESAPASPFLYFPPTQAAAMPVPPPPAPPPEIAPAVLAAPAPVENRVAIRARGAQVWIQVRERGGPVLVDRVLQPGDSQVLPNRANLTLTTGNALATEFLVDGETTLGLGGAKGVKRDLTIDPDAIKDGRLAGLNGTVTRPQ